MLRAKHSTKWASLDALSTALIFKLKHYQTPRAQALGVFFLNNSRRLALAARHA